jgi:hypothetical protein
MPPEEIGTSQGDGASTTATDQGSEPKSQGDAPDLTAMQSKIADLESDNKKYRDERRAAEEKRAQDEAEAEAAKLSSQERTAKEIAELKQALADATQVAQTKGSKVAFLEAATKAKATYPEDIYKLVDHSAIKFDDDGEVTNAVALVEALKKERPGFFAGGGSFDGGARTSQDPPTDMNQALRQAAGRR